THAPSSTRFCPRMTSQYNGRRAGPDITFVGRSVTRLEARPLVTGRGAFAADVAFPHMLHMRVVRSAHAHGRIISIDTSAALKLPGVAAVWTSADVSEIPPIDFRLTRIEGLAPYRQPILARQRVRYVGEPVAAVFATDPYVAEDAADLVAVAVEELPVILDAGAAPGEFEDGRSTEPAVVEKSYGDVAAAFRDAAVVVELDLSVGRHSGVPLETRGAIARYEAARDVLELYGAAKVPHWNRDSIARMLRRSAASVHLFEGHVGGGFGIRGELYPEDVLVCLAALRLGRPAKWIEDRREHLIAANHSRQQRHKVRARSMPKAASSPSTTNSSTTRAAMCAPTRPRCPISPRQCCRARIACRPIGRSGACGSPTRRGAAPTAPLGGSKLRLCASG